MKSVGWKFGDKIEHGAAVLAKTVFPVDCKVDTMIHHLYVRLNTKTGHPEYGFITETEHITEYPVADEPAADDDGASW